MERMEEREEAGKGRRVHLWHFTAVLFMCLKLWIENCKNGLCNKSLSQPLNLKLYFYGPKWNNQPMRWGNLIFLISKINHFLSLFESNLIFLSVISIFLPCFQEFTLISVNYSNTRDCRGNDSPFLRLCRHTECVVKSLSPGWCVLVL